MSYVYASEIPGMLASIRQDGVTWLIAPKTVVKWEGDGWCIYENYSLRQLDEAECVVYAKSNREITEEIKTYL